jgi:hypothetical protein
MKSTLTVACAVLGVAMSVTAVGVMPTLAQEGDSRIQRGLALAPVPLNLTGLNKARVGLGSYIVNAQGGCNDCHTAPSYEEGGNPFLGQPEVINSARYLAGGQQFGPFVSRNLTPRANGRPANLTLEQFIETMQTGRDFKPGIHPGIPLLQVMPWPVYGQMSDKELEAIYEFLRAIPSLPTITPPA